MKKIILFTFFALVISQYAFSQIYAGGSISYYNSKLEISNKTDTSETFDISFSLGYRLGYFELGGLFIYQTETDTRDSGKVEATGFGVYSNYSYYIIENELFYVAARISAQYINSKTSVNYTGKILNYYPQTIEQNSVSIRISPIFDYSLTRYISLYTAVGSISFSYSWGERTIYEADRITINSKDKFTNNSYGLSLSTEVTLGLAILLF